MSDFKLKMWIAAVVLALFSAIIYFGAGGGIVLSPSQAVAAKAENEYEIASRQGDKTQICVQAGLVAAAYLQASNEDKYNEWKAREAADCSAIGIRY